MVDEFPQIKMNLKKCLTEALYLPYIEMTISAQLKKFPVC